MSVEDYGISVDTVCLLLAAMLVFFMQPGFALCEAGFTRSKNTANILFKNFVDFMIGSVLFWFVGFGFMFGSDGAGFIGMPNFGDLSFYTNAAGLPTEGFLMFETVFCATSATIVSGAMAERTNFLSYCIYSGIISAVVYPIEAHWIWGGGWLAQMGFHDFAGSCAIHMVGGFSALIGAWMEGPRLGKYNKDGTPNAIPGHNVVIGALGCFILWFGWYGFNGAAATNGPQLASIFATTTIAPAIATVTCMIFTWVKYGKPDVSMCLNASLAGLVGITAGCDTMDAMGAFFVGVVSGLLVCFGVWFCDYVIRVDDPVGAVAVHFCNGLWGTIAVGLFATTSAPSCEINGLFYGGGVHQLILQLTGVGSVLLWTGVTMFIVFKVIDKIFGLRVTDQEQLDGLDIHEHGMNAYYGFRIDK